VIFPGVQEIVTQVPQKVPEIGKRSVLAPITGAVLSSVMEARVVPVFIQDIFVAVNCACFTPLESEESAPVVKV
jgi:hypothetical protein